MQISRLALSSLTVFLALLFITTSCSKADNLASEMILIPGGEFTLGRTVERGDEWYPGLYYIGSELPAHEVFVESFYIDKYETTVDSFEIFLKKTKRKYPATFTYKDYYKSGYPAQGMNWRDAYDYCKWVGKRLPTEVEWERAARGDDDRVFPWGNEFNRSALNYGYHSNPKKERSKDPYSYTSPVGRFPEGASPYGVMDMAGNLWEWTSSQYRPYPYVKDDGREDKPGRKDMISARGGAFDSWGGQLYTFYRMFPYPEDHGLDIGFRCAKDLEPVENK